MGVAFASSFQVLIRIRIFLLLQSLIPFRLKAFLSPSLVINPRALSRKGNTWHVGPCVPINQGVKAIDFSFKCEFNELILSLWLHRSIFLISCSRSHHRLLRPHRGRLHACNKYVRPSLDLEDPGQRASCIEPGRLFPTVLPCHNPRRAY